MWQLNSTMMGGDLRSFAQDVAVTWGMLVSANAVIRTKSTELTASLSILMKVQTSLMRINKLMRSFGLSWADFGRIKCK